ncbi:MAG: aldo/keto reductase [Panacagrimonas sp.]
MRYRSFGRRAGLRVSELALGTGNFGTGWGHGAEPAEARRMLDRYAEAGGNFIDTADNYQLGQSESLLGEFLAGQRDRFVLASKFSLGIAPGGGDGLLATGNGRKTMTRAVEASLKRLKTDYLDLYWAHLPDGVTLTEEILRGFDDLARSGKILFGGLSNFPAWRVARADLLADVRGWAPLAGIQIEYSLAERTPDRELIPMAEALGLGVAMWSPLGGGFLTGKYRGGEQGRLEKLGVLIHTEKTARESAVLDAVLAVAEESKVSAAEIAIAWLLACSAASPTNLVPILGPRNVAQLEPALSALRVVLSAEQLERLNSASAIPLGVPHEQIRDLAGVIATGMTSPHSPVV